MREQWRDIPGWEGKYQVSNKGGVRSFTGWGGRKRAVPKLLSLRTRHDGYLDVKIGGAGWKPRVHTLVLTAFVGPCPDGYECLHLDDVPGNNCVRNLKWGTRSENQKQAYAHGRKSVFGTKNPRYIDGRTCKDNVLGRTEYMAAYNRRWWRDKGRDRNDARRAERQAKKCVY